MGDKLRPKRSAGAEFLYGCQWAGIGYVQSLLDGEVMLEIKHGPVPEQVSEHYLVEYIWKSTSFDRMQNALKTFALDDTRVTGYIYKILVCHLSTNLRDKLSKHL